MERLTEMNENGTAHFYPQCFEKCGGIGYSRKCDDCNLLDRVCDKLGEYEDLEEQGKLWRLPCTVEDKIYLPNKYLGKVIDFEITRICIFKEEIMFIDNLENEYFIDDFGKTVFTTKEEAEAALKEMGEKS